MKQTWLHKALKALSINNTKIDGPLHIQCPAATSVSISHCEFNGLGNCELEMRWVVTPDLDGRQLQYRYQRNQSAMSVGPHPAGDWSEWKPVTTIFVTKKLPDPSL